MSKRQRTWTEVAKKVSLKENFATNGVEWSQATYQANEFHYVCVRTHTHIYATASSIQIGKTLLTKSLTHNLNPNLK